MTGLKETPVLSDSDTRLATHVAKVTILPPGEAKGLPPKYSAVPNNTKDHYVYPSTEIFRGHGQDYLDRAQAPITNPHEPQNQFMSVPMQPTVRIDREKEKQLMEGVHYDD